MNHSIWRFLTSNPAGATAGSTSSEALSPFLGHSLGRLKEILAPF